MRQFLPSCDIARCRSRPLRESPAECEEDERIHTRTEIPTKQITLYRCGLGELRFRNLHLRTEKYVHRPIERNHVVRDHNAWFEHGVGYLLRDAGKIKLDGKRHPVVDDLRRVLQLQRRSQRVDLFAELRRGSVVD